MIFKSTRGQAKPATFEEVTMMGLADDGGLYIPETIPKIDLHLLLNDTFQEVFYKVISPFACPTSIPHADLRKLISKSFSSFRIPDVVDVKQIGDLYLLELFHGPTFAFKDVALQFLGNVFEYFLKRRGKSDKPGTVTKMTIVGATSGDTGSAAIYGLRGKKNVEVFILYPYGRVTPIQEMQMTTVMDRNVHNIAVKGTFDDCQTIVKSLLFDLDFKSRFSLGTVNSINLTRILAQVSYYMYAYVLMLRKNYIQVDPIKGIFPEISFSVPTGNSGDILAGFYAKLMGLPISKLFLCTNRNNTLHRFFTNGDYFRSPMVYTTHSPSMDIQVASNFERYLYFLANEDHTLLAKWMKIFETTGKLSLPSYVPEANKYVLSADVSDEETLATIKDIHHRCNFTLCPHSAVGVCGAIKIKNKTNMTEPCICLATAHSAKFIQVVSDVIGKENYKMPDELQVLFSKPTRVDVIENNTQKIKMFIVQTLLNKKKSNL